MVAWPVAAARGRPDHRLDRIPRDAAGPQQHRRAAEAGDDGRFDAHVGRSPVHHGVDAPVEVGDDMGGGGRADMAGAVGGGRGDRAAGGGEQRLRHRVARHAQAHCLKAGAGEVGDVSARGGGHDQRQRSGPEGAGESGRIGVEATEAERRLDRRHVGDQRVEARPPLAA
jgi:hypothetical protein